jgi:anti-sigma factor RsiW
MVDRFAAACCSVTAGADDGGDDGVADPDAVLDADRLVEALALPSPLGVAGPADAVVVLAALLWAGLAAGWLNGCATTRTVTTAITSAGTRISTASEERDRFPSCRRGG